MGAVEALHLGVAAVAHELTLFAAVGFLIGGLDDLIVDAMWIARRLWRRVAVYSRHQRATAATLHPAQKPGRLAVFVAAWREHDVIGPMLRHALAAYDHPDYRIYVGCYPNDPETLAAVRAVDDPRVRIALNSNPGPTTKADNLNAIWRAMLADEATSGERFKAVVLHDAEDVAHSAELHVFDSLIERFDLVQLPVLPLVDGGSRWVSGHYIDEFTEAHGKQLVLREAVGAGVPSAGVGCAIARAALALVADANGGLPFDPDSLTEDYELGLRIAENGRGGVFVRLASGPGGAPVATRAHFPNSFGAAVRQKARWMVGIALAGWDRLGWRGGVSERWMRLRDRRALLAALVLLAAYASLVMWGLAAFIALLTGGALHSFGPVVQATILADTMILAWRLLMRFGFVARAYGWREGLRSVPRALVGNAIAIFAARQAVSDYLRMRRDGRVRWSKTEHIFPARVPAE